MRDDNVDFNQAAPSPLRLRLKYFGVFEAQLSNGDVVPISATKARAILVYLAMAPEMRHTREHMAALLWDRSDNEHARASLRQAVAALRKAFGPLSDQFLLADDPEIIGLQPSAIEIDPHSENATGAYGRTDFLANLNIRSDPFEDWRREQAAHFAADDAAPPTPRASANPTRSTNINPQPKQQAAQPPISSSRRQARPYHYALYGALGVILLSLAGGAYLTSGANRPGSVQLHGQNAIEITRQAAALAKHPNLAAVIELCKFDRVSSKKTINACTRVINALGNDEPYKAIALTIRGTAYRWDADYNRAKEDFAQAIIVDDTYYNAHHGIAYTYYLTRDFDLALHHYERVKKILPIHVMAHYRTGEVYFAMEQYKQAATAFTDTIALSPNSGHAYYFRAKSRLELGQKEAAKDDLRMAASVSSSLRTEAQALYAEIDE